MKNCRIELPAIFADGMVLQREKPLRIWGRAAEGVTAIRAAFAGTAAEAAVEEDGRFRLTLPPLPAAKNQTLQLCVGGETAPELILRDVSLGDVWLACGQSNMEFFLRYDAHWCDIRDAAQNPDIRMFNVPRIAFPGQRWTHEEDSGFWFQEGHAAWDVFSAPGHAFARVIQETQGVPVGIVGCSWGGTPACAWMDESYLEDEQLHVFLDEYKAEAGAWDAGELREASLRALEFENSYRHELEWRVMMYGLTYADQQRWMKEHESDPQLPMGPYHHYRPSGLYHTMLETIAPFSVKGILWYQGESDSGHADIYDRTMAALIRCFRDTFEDDELPFLFVQLAPFEKWLDCTAENYTEVRRRQEMAAARNKNTWMTCIMDIGERDDIHPKRKREVGERLALLARGHVYGEPVLSDPPEFAEGRREGNRLRLSFRNADGGLRLGPAAADCFKISLSAAGSSSPAAGGPHCAAQEVEPQPAVTAIKADGSALLLELTDVPDVPLAISFAEENYCEVRIWNTAGLPVKPFAAVIS